jgi:molybdopterin converting factor small subunit
MHEQEKTAVILRLPSTLSAYSDGKSQLLLNADTIEQLFSALEQEYPLVWKQLCDGPGKVRKQFNIFVNNQLVTSSNDPAILLKAGQEVIVLPVIGPEA